MEAGITRHSMFNLCARGRSRKDLDGAYRKHIYVRIMIEYIANLADQKSPVMHHRLRVGNHWWSKGLSTLTFFGGPSFIRLAVHNHRKRRLLIERHIFNSEYVCRRSLLALKSATFPNPLKSLLSVFTLAPHMVGFVRL